MIHRKWILTVIFRAICTNTQNEEERKRYINILGRNKAALRNNNELHSMAKAIYILGHKYK
jgi:hypothetical protein